MKRWCILWVLVLGITGSAASRAGIDEDGCDANLQTLMEQARTVSSENERQFIKNSFADPPMSAAGLACLPALMTLQNLMGAFSSLSFSISGAISAFLSQLFQQFLIALVQRVCAQVDAFLMQTLVKPIADLQAQLLAVSNLPAQLQSQITTRLNQVPDRILPPVQTPQPVQVPNLYERLRNAIQGR